MSEDRVYAVDEYYDGPRTGIADYGSAPHYFRSVYLDSQEWNPDEDRFELSPISAAAVAWELEDHELWSRWNAAYRAGTLTDECPERVLPQDEPRHRELRQLLEPHLRIDPANCVLARAEFVAGPVGESASSAFCGNMRVRWSRGWE